MRYIPKLTLVVISSLIALQTTNATRFNVWQPENGIPVRAGSHPYWLPSSFDQTEDGSTLIAWSESLSGNQDVYAQLYSSTGDPLWNEPVVVASGAQPEIQPCIWSSENGTWLISWGDFTNGGYEPDGLDEDNPPYRLFVNKINAAGEILWGQDGVDMGIWVDVGHKPWLYPDQNGGCFRVINQATIQHWDQDGNPQFAGDGIDSGFHYLVSSNSILPLEDGGFIAFGIIEDIEFGVQRFDANGFPLWQNGVPVTTGIYYERIYSPMVLSGGDIAWIYVDTVTDQDRIMAQRLTMEGEFLWGENGVVVADRNYTGPIIATPDGSGNFFLLWLEQNNDNTTIYGQRIDFTGDNPVLTWGNASVEGQVVVEDDEYLDDVSTDVTPDGNLVLAWLNEEYIPWQNYAQLAFQIWLASGEPAFTQPLTYDAEGIDKFNLKLHENNAQFAWFKVSNGTEGLFHQVLNIESGEPLVDPTETAIASSLTMGISAPSAAISGDYFWSSWRDSRGDFDHQDIYLQAQSRLDGSALFPDNGIMVAETGLASTHGLVSDNDGGVITCWINRTESDADPGLSAARVLTDGTLPWGSNGVEVIPDGFNHGVQYATLYRFADQNTTGIIAEVYNDLYYVTIYYTAIDDNGNVVLSTPMMLVPASSDGECGIECVFPAPDNTFYLFYHIIRLGVLTAYVNRIDILGNRLWNEPVEISDFAYHRDEFFGVGVENDLLVVHVDNGEDEKTAYAQRINPDGVKLWAGAGRQIIEPQTQSFYLRGATFTAGSFYVAKYNNDTNQIQINRFDGEANPMWPVDHQWTVVTENGYFMQENAAFVPDEDGGLHAIYEQFDTSQWITVYYKHYTPDGEFADPGYIDNAILANGWYNQRLAEAIPDREGGFFAIWHNEETSGDYTDGDLFAMRVNDYTTGVEDRSGPAHPMSWSLSEAWPNPFNSVASFTFTVPQSGKVTLAVYDLLGREVAKLVDHEFSAGVHKVNWNGETSNSIPASSGAYFIRMNCGSRLFSQRVVLLK